MAATLIKTTLQMSLRATTGFSNLRALSSNPTSSRFFTAPSNPMLQSSELMMIKQNAMQTPLVFETVQNDSLLPQYNQIGELQCPTDSLYEPLQAIKRTYQPSVLRRKRKHGFRSRRVSISGRKVLNRRFNKGRWRMSL